MNKQEFLAALRQGLNGLLQNEIEEHVSFYSEMISDYMEEGLSEEQAVSTIAPINEILSQINESAPSTNQKPFAKKRFKAWEIVLLVLGSPIWISLLIAVLAVAIALYASLWSVIISLWAVFAALSGSALGCLITGVFTLGKYNPTALATLGLLLVCTGLSILAFLACKAVTKATVCLTKKVVLQTKNRLLRKEQSV